MKRWVCGRTWKDDILEHRVFSNINLNPQPITNISLCVRDSGFQTSIVCGNLTMLSKSQLYRQDQRLKCFWLSNRSSTASKIVLNWFTTTQWLKGKSGVDTESIYRATIRVLQLQGSFEKDHFQRISSIKTISNRSCTIPMSNRTVRSFNSDIVTTKQW